MRRLIFLGAFLLAPIFSAARLLSALEVFQTSNLFNSNVTAAEMAMICHLLICVVSLWVMYELCVVLWISKNSSANISTVHPRRFSAIFLGGLALIGHSHSMKPNNVGSVQEASLPVEIVLTPAMATLLLRDILHRRRQQIREESIPDVFSDEEVTLLSEVQMIAANDSGALVVGALNSSIPIVNKLTEAVERKEDRPKLAIDRPLFIVRLYGFPEVHSCNGSQASFRKKRALELLVWLSLNRDRPRRSAARTALWHIDVSDATFSTVVSDMRRGLSEMDFSINRNEILPATYSDELLLSTRVTTDYDLLCESLAQFREDKNDYLGLARQLAEIRDAPFSGTSYEWADLDGTTTRLIIAAMQASHELAEFALSRGDVALMTTAVTAGLRVMPGNEQLLQIQQSFIPDVSMSRSLKIY